MKRYTLRPVYDENIVIDEFEAKTYKEALEKALDILGYDLFYVN